MNNILEYLENTVKKYSDKVAYTDGENGMTFGELSHNAKAIGTAIAKTDCFREPVIVFMGKTPATVAAFMGVIYSGNYYVPIDEEMPKTRIDLIISGLNPRQIICSRDVADHIEEFTDCKNILVYEDLIDEEIDEELLLNIRNRQIDTAVSYTHLTLPTT